MELIGMSEYWQQIHVDNTSL